MPRFIRLALDPSMSDDTKAATISAYLERFRDARKDLAKLTIAVSDDQESQILLEEAGNLVVEAEARLHRIVKKIQKGAQAKKDKEAKDPNREMPWEKAKRERPDVDWYNQDGPGDYLTDFMGRG